jgi:hypothetical protein
MAGGIGLFLLVFLAVCVYNRFVEVETSSWLSYWKVYLSAMFALGTVFLVWITIGGFRDLSRLFRLLRTQGPNTADDGSVEGHHASG